MDQEQQSKKMGQIIAKCWADDSFKQQLLADPITTLKMEGMELSKGLDVKVLIDTDALFHLVIPFAPVDLTDEELDAVAGGAVFLGLVPGMIVRRDFTGVTRDGG